MVFFRLELELFGSVLKIYRGWKEGIAKTYIYINTLYVATFQLKYSIFF